MSLDSGLATDGSVLTGDRRSKPAGVFGGSFIGSRAMSTVSGTGCTSSEGAATIITGILSLRPPEATSFFESRSFLRSSLLSNIDCLVGFLGDRTGSVFTLSVLEISRRFCSYQRMQPDILGPSTLRAG